MQCKCNTQTQHLALGTMHTNKQHKQLNATDHDRKNKNAPHKPENRECPGNMLQLSILEMQFSPFYGAQLQCYANKLTWHLEKQCNWWMKGEGTTEGEEFKATIVGKIRKKIKLTNKFKKLISNLILL